MVNSTKSNVETLNKIVMFTIDTYIAGMKDNKEVLPPILERVAIALAGMRHTRPFTQNEASKVIMFGKDKELTDIVNKPVSHIIFILELLKLWIEDIPRNKRPLFNISDKKMSVPARSIVTMQMLKLKKSDGDTHAEKKQIIMDSESVAKEFYEYHKRKLNVN